MTTNAKPTVRKEEDFDDDARTVGVCAVLVILHISLKNDTF